ncbi:MAG: hypothetical protein AABX10_02425 [Nanoarchaeota archaeon]
MKINVTSLFDTKRSFWMKIKSSDEVIKALHDSLKSINENISGLETPDLENWCGSSDLHLKSFKEFNDLEFKFFENNEDIYIIFTASYCNLILFKDSKKFDQIKKTLSEKFKI